MGVREEVPNYIFGMDFVMSLLTLCILRTKTLGSWSHSLGSLAIFDFVLQLYARYAFLVVGGGRGRGEKFQLLCFWRGLCHPLSTLYILRTKALGSRSAMVSKACMVMFGFVHQSMMTLCIQL